MKLEAQTRLISRLLMKRRQVDHTLVEGRGRPETIITVSQKYKSVVRGLVRLT